jgi:hypothetical protein
LPVNHRFFFRLKAGGIMEQKSARERFDAVIDSPLASVFGLITILTTLWGLLSIYKDLAGALGSKAAAIGLTCFALLSVVVIVISFLLRRGRFNLPLGNRYIFINVKNNWSIDNDGNGMIELEKTYLFFEQPDETDLSDIALGSTPLELADLKFESSDAEPTNYEAIDENTHRIYWKPKT